MKSLLLIGVLVMSTSARAEVVTRKVEWGGGHEGVGYLGTFVYDDALAKKGKLPAVMVVHQWMGPTDYELMRAKMLAELGYAAFVADVYGIDTRPTDAKQAGGVAGKLRGDRAELRRRLAASFAAMLAQREADAAKTAAIGYCFGGTAVLELARSGAKVGGVVSFHGGLDSPTPADGKNISAKVLVLHGAADPHVKKADIEAFIAELDAAKVDWQKIDYAEAVHSFTQVKAGNDPSKGSAYNERADRRSWEAMKLFLAEILRY